MRKLAFRLRIALLSALVSGAVLLGFGVTAWFLMYRERLAALDREILALAYRHPGWMGGRANYERLSSVIELIFGEERKEQIILLVKDARGQTRYVSAHWPKELDPETLDLNLQATPGVAPTAIESNNFSNRSNERITPSRRGPPWLADNEMGAGSGPGFGRSRGGAMAPFTFSRVACFQTIALKSSAWRLGILGNDNDRLVLGISLADLQAELGRMRNAFLVVLPLALFGIGWGGWWVAGYAIRPLRSIAQVAERITARGLDQRIPLSDEDPEIARLIRVLNGMMDRLESSFHQATRFSADASHELKTPLAVMQGELENALQSAPQGSNEQHVFANLLDETQRLKAITNSLLLLAQADAGQLQVSLDRVDLSAALRGLEEDVETMAAEVNIKVHMRLEPGIWVQADWPLLRQAVFNLLRNALCYNEAGGWIEVILASRNGQIEIGVSNSGPGISPTDQNRLFERFFRADAARSRRIDGFGLGLSLAREIVRVHRGSLVLKESRPGRTCFVLSLPESRMKNSSGS